ncbi:MAG: HDIG domain protein [Candidatus Ozemobacter sibiricus]|jgi:putative nucleotidyltransferase with HDIG domain|uniref:HDIG domain protein n=1 Tax=Candidatus Ozemobacter sibiricus TaxID=2268124 RepID=A0A367ZRW2_9BACT|nr:MAG: HDIG domain protein [Candidatus Ozemobacter sibiricus]
MITLARARALLDQHLGANPALRNHSLATGAIMRALADRFGEPADDWEALGLLHDLDFEQTRDTPARHTLETVEWLRPEGVPEPYLQAIVAHNEATGAVRADRLAHALAAAESVTGLVMACAFVLPDRQIASVKVGSLRKRMKEKAFARNVSRETILECEKIGIPLDEFFALAIAAMAPLQETLIARTGPAFAAPVAPSAPPAPAAPAASGESGRSAGAPGAASTTGSTGS